MMHTLSRHAHRIVTLALRYTPTDNKRDLQQAAVVASGREMAEDHMERSGLLVVAGRAVVVQDGFV